MKKKAGIIYTMGATEAKKFKINEKKKKRAKFEMKANGKNRIKITKLEGNSDKVAKVMN